MPLRPVCKACVTSLRGRPSNLSHACERSQPPDSVRANDERSQPKVADHVTRVFISSTWRDLRPEREAVERALDRLGRAAFGGMEYFASRPETPPEASLLEVDRTDIFVGIFGHRFESGLTEAEYNRAKQRQLPCLIFFKDDQDRPDTGTLADGQESTLEVQRLETLKRNLALGTLV